MKKIIAGLSGIVLMLSLVGCARVENNGAGENNGEGSGADGETAVQVLEKIWAGYEDENRFSAGGGNADNLIENAPGAFDITLTNDMDTTLGLPADQAKNISDAASLMHMLNANTFTGACYTLKDGVDSATVAKAIHTHLKDRQWICGFPDKLLVMGVNGNQIITAFGAKDVVDHFKSRADETYPDATVLTEENLA